MNDKNILVCVRKSNALGSVSGTSMDICSQCKEPVLIAPTGRCIVAEKNAEIFCGQCAAPLASRNDVEMHMPNREQIKEVLHVLWTEWAHDHWN